MHLKVTSLAIRRKGSTVLGYRGEVGSDGFEFQLLRKGVMQLKMLF